MRETAYATAGRARVQRPFLFFIPTPVDEGVEALRRARFHAFEIFVIIRMLRRLKRNERNVFFWTEYKHVNDALRNSGRHEELTDIVCVAVIAIARTCASISMRALRNSATNSGEMPMPWPISRGCSTQ